MLTVVNSWGSQVVREVPWGGEGLADVVGGNEVVFVAWKVVEGKGRDVELVGLAGGGAGAGGEGEGGGEERVKIEDVFRRSRWISDDDDGDDNSNNSSGSSSGSGRGSSSGSGRGGGKKRPLSVLDCLDKFTEREQLSPEETLYCSSCKRHLAPVKKMDLWSAPEVLIVHLKRFMYSPGQYFVHREKINEVGGWVGEQLC